MKLESFIARRLFFRKSEGGKKTGPSVKIAVIGITVGLAVMIVAVAVVLGFKREVREKIVGMGAHIQVTSYYSNFTYEMNPLVAPDSMLSRLAAIDGVRHVQRLYTKPGMIKTDEDYQAVVFKGVDTGFDNRFLSQSLVRGEFPDYSSPSNQVLISEYISKLMHLDVGSSFLAYFVKEDAVAARKFTVSGIYNTYFTAYDKAFVITDSRHIKKLNLWYDNEAGGIEIFFKSMEGFEKSEELVFQTMSRISAEEDSVYYIKNLYVMNPDLFGWLDLLDMNVILILFIMIFVSGFNIISGILILILEKTNMIGILKALGASSNRVRKLFIHYSFFLIGKGLLWGNLIGLSLLFIQNYFKVLKLDPEVYYVNFVPVEINGWIILALNAGTVLISLAVVLIPSALISKIQPVRAIRFE